MEHVITGVMGFIAGLFAPWVKWGIEKRRERLRHRRDLVAKWRRMIQTVAGTPIDPALGVTHLLERHEDYYSLRPHLSTKTLGEIHSPHTWDGSSIGAELNNTLDDIAEIERKWGLV